MKLAAFILCAIIARNASGEDFTEHRIRNDEHLRYRVFAPKAETDEHRLVVFLPGGDGSDAFTPWLLNIYRNALPEEFLAVQLIAPKWTTDQQVVWPTKKTPARKMGEPVEKFFETVVRKVSKTHKIAKGEIYTFSWSSGGVPAFLIAAEKRGDVRGSFVSMAVYRDGWVPKNLKKVRGQRFFLYHSPEDKVTPFSSAEGGKTALEKNGAEVRLETYSGGHGWRLGAGHFPDIRRGMEWLIKKE